MIAHMIASVPVFRWVLGAAVGFAIAGALFHFPGSFPVGSGNLGVSPAVGALGALQGAISGAIAGALLWWAIRPLATRWLILATAVGFAVTHALGDGLSTGVDYLPIGLVGGAALGIAQLRQFRDPPAPFPYVATSSLGLAAGLVVGIALIESLGLTRLEWTPAVGMQQHGIASAVTGLLWSWGTGRRILRRRQAPAAA